MRDIGMGLLLMSRMFNITNQAAADHLAYTRRVFQENAEAYAQIVEPSSMYRRGDDLVWIQNPKAWHQQTARTIDFHFTTFDELESFARKAKKAGVSTLMLEKINKMGSCPGPWYNGLQMCEHINGTFPAADGTLERWQKMLADIKPMKLMWWWNPAYWSTQGEVWKEAVASPKSNVGQFFSWNVTDDDVCDGFNPCASPAICTETNDTCTGAGCAQGSWGSDGAFKGIKSAMSSFGSAAYADYLVSAMAESWTKNLGIDGYTTDCSGNYNPTGKTINPSFGRSGCPNGMLQTGGDSLKPLSAIVDRVRATQPQVVMSGEFYGSWDEVMHSHADVGGPGFPEYHTAFQSAVSEGDASGIEDYASNSGADAASVLCYMHPYYDGQQPGACPSMYFRDTTPPIADARQHELWVALEAASGIVPQHDGEPGRSFYNVSMDPMPSGGAPESRLWAFHKYRALNRLALRTKLNMTSARGAGKDARQQKESRGGSGYHAYEHVKCDLYDGGIPRGLQPFPGLTAAQCQGSCDQDAECDCVSFIAGYNGHTSYTGHTGHADRSGSPKPATPQSRCWKFSHCIPARFANNSGTAAYTVFVKDTPPAPPPNRARGALAYLKHDALGPQGDAAIVLFNPGAAQNVSIDLSLLPASVFGITPVDLLQQGSSAHSSAHSSTSVAAPPLPPLAKWWTVEIGAGEVKAFSGFTLGVFAPRRGKKQNCKADDSYRRPAAGKTLEACFLECLKDARCENVYVDYIDVVWMEQPPPAHCTLLGALKDPSSTCEPGNGTLITKLPGARSCASRWRKVGAEAPIAGGAPLVPPGPPSPWCAGS